MKKYWETGEKNDFGKECYRLHFSQFYEEDDENVVAGFVQDEADENIFIYVSKELNVEYDTLFAEAKNYNKYYNSSYGTAGLHRVGKLKI